MIKAARDTQAARPLLGALVCERVRLAAQCALGRQQGEDPGESAVALATVTARLAGSAGASLRRLCDLFRLNAREQDVLATCVALALDPRLEALFRQIEASAGRSYVTGALVAALFGHPPGHVWNPAGALALWELASAHAVGPGEPDALTVDPVVPAWIAGELWIDRSLAGFVRKAEPGILLASWPVETLAAAVRKAIASGRPIRVAISGEPGSGRSAFGAAVAAAASLPALVVDTTDIDDADWPQSYVRLQRLAAISGTALIWTGSQVARPWPALVAPAPVHFLAVEPSTTLRPLAQRPAYRIDLPEPTIAEREELWRTLASAVGGWSEHDVEALARRYRLGTGDFLTVAAEAPATPALAAHAARNCRRPVTEDFLHAVPCPFTWDDLITPEALKSALADLAFEAAERERVWEDVAGGRLFPREAGLVALFSGPSGTGKTMAAQVIAAHLELDLLRADLALISSKYIGETAKNLNRVFALARHRQAVLLFDEADAYFARRTEIKDAHDRYANADTNHLLQLIEGHRGIVILATNRRSDMDPAFVRRLRHVLEFPRPQPTERLKLWHQALSAVAPQQWSALSARMTLVADAVDLAGAQIKNAALSALFMARRDGAPVAFEHVIRGLDRELAKEGRPLAPKDKERWLRHG